MRLRVLALLLYPFLAQNVLFGEDPVISDRTNADWKLTANHNDIAVYSRPHPGSSLKEFKAIGDVAAAPAQVHQVIDDVNGYPSFMPYVSECYVLRRDSDSLITYQRVSPKICCDRDYALRIREKTWPTPAGLVYSNQWASANEFAPAKKSGVVRISFCQGGWLLEPGNGGKTRATYSIFSDTGGLIPAFMANHFSQGAIEKVFAAIRQRVKDPKYNSVSASNKPGA